MEVFVDEFCTMVQTKDVKVLNHMLQSLLHTIHYVFPPMAMPGLGSGDPISERKFLKGEGLWDVRKEILGWLFDGARRLVDLLTQKLDDLINEVEDIQRHQAISFKCFKKVVGQLRHAAIGLPVGKGLCTPLNCVITIHRPIVPLSKSSPVRAAFADWN